MAIDRSTSAALANVTYTVARTGDLAALAGLVAPGADGDSKCVAGVA